MRKLLLALLLVSCGDDQELYPKRSGHPCRLGDPGVCADEGFRINCEPPSAEDIRMAIPEARQRAVASGFAGVWHLDASVVCP